MMPQDLISITNWWLVLFILGLGFLPLTLKIFSTFWDRGYAFSKILAVVLSTYAVWLLGSLKLVPFSRLSAFALFLVLAALIWRYFMKNREITHLKETIKFHWKVFLFEEIIFALSLFIWSWVRSVQPDIDGLEKFMDFGFINSILRSEYFPPSDIWYAGNTINYYYFGHLMAAFLTKLSNLDSAVTYNLMIATVFAFSITLGFSLSSNIYHLFRKTKENLSVPGKFPLIIVGFVSALLLSLGSNLHTGYYVLRNGAEKYWYPDATRFIGYNPPTEDKTIHEFPAYSFTVSDYHSHLADLPLVLLILALTTVIYVNWRRWAGWKNALRQLIIPAIVLAAMYMTNSSDAILYWALFAGMFFILYCQKRNITVIQTAFSSILLLIFLLMFSLPFHLNFQSLIKGINFVHTHSYWWQILILWGAPMGLIFIYLLLLFRRKILNPAIIRRLIKVVGHIFGLKIEVENDLKDNLSDEKTTNGPRLTPIDWLVILLSLFALGCVAAPEIIYFKDIYIASHYRGNTMLKFSYQAFIVFSLISGFLMARILSLIAGVRRRFLTGLLFTVLVTVLLIYPYFSIYRGYYGDLKNYKGLYGLDFLKRLSSDDFKAIAWLKDNAGLKDVVLEAVGESYTQYARVSMATGIPTVLGWPVHEWLWRGSYDGPGKRREDVRIMYESGDSDETRKLLGDYSINYVFLGKLERDQYRNLNEAKFDQLGTVVYQSGESKIYKIQRY